MDAETSVSKVVLNVISRYLRGLLSREKTPGGRSHN